MSIYMNMKIPFLDLPLPDDAKSLEEYYQRFQREYSESKKKQNLREFKIAERRVTHLLEKSLLAKWERYGLPKPHPLPEEHEYDDYATDFFKRYDEM